MFDHDIKWLCGVIDTEGSFSMSYKRAKRGRRTYRIRTCRLRISTTDDIIIPAASKLLGHSQQRSHPRNKRHSPRRTITIIGGQLRRLLPKLIPHLYTKQPQAKLLLAALNVKNGQNSFYALEESQLWDSIYRRVRELNQVGKRAIEDQEPREHEFSWPWLAGMTDGDGAIINAKFGKGGCTIKPVHKIALAHQQTIRYLESQLGVNSLRAGGGKDNKRPVRSIRLMAEKQREILPKIIPYLQLKRKHAEIALEIANIRAALPSGAQWQSHLDEMTRIKQLLDELNGLNAKSGKSNKSR
jgi:hypothetical protein